MKKTEREQELSIMVKIKSTPEKKETVPLTSKSPESLQLQTESSVVNVNIDNSVERNRSKPSALQLIRTLAIFFLKKCWMSCSAATFVIFVIYWCYGGFFALILLIFALTGFIFQLGDFFLYHPDQPPQSRLYVPLPSLFDLPAESVYIQTADGVKLHAFFIKQDPSIISHVSTLLYFHGNAGNIGHRLPNAKGLYSSSGFNILLVEYRGYGHSEGTPSEEGLYLDAQAGMKYLLQQPYIDKNKIVVFGRSLGGAVAIDLAANPEFSKHVFGLIVENTFTSIPDIAKEMFSSRLLNWLPSWAFKNQFLSLDKIRKVKAPTLFISGKEDAIIPECMMKALCQHCGSPLKQFQSFEYGTHNETWRCYGYYRVINLFIDNVMFSQRGVQQWPG